MGELKKNNKALDHKCPSCKAPLKYYPKLGKWKCEYCENEYTLEDLKKYNNASNEKVNDGVNGDDTIYDSYKCPDCGAEIIADANTTATFCVYCGNTAILKSKLSGKFAPTKIIPFKNVKDDAVAAFKKIKKGRPLLPKGFTSIENIEKIRGIYIPFWLYDIIVDGELDATGKRITSWTMGEYHYTKTDTYKLVRSGSMKYLLVPVDGSTRFDNDIMNTIEPFDYNELVDYNHAYLSGFLAEKYDIEWENAIKDAVERTRNSTIDEMKSTMIGYSGVIISNDSLIANEEKHNYVLLPVWMVNVKYKDKYYTFAMNGQTGEFIGNMPISIKKTILISLIIFIVVLVIVLIGSYIIYMVGA